MGIAYISALAAGTALKVILSPKPGAVSWTLLRRTDAAFTGPSDTGAYIVASQFQAGSVLDIDGLTNGTLYYYQLYSSADGETYVADGVPAEGTPAVSYVDLGEDPQELLIARLEAGLAGEVAMGNLIPTSGKVPVYRAPFVLADKLTLPCVTVHVDDTSASDRYIGDDTAGIGFDAAGDFADSEGWLASWSLAVIGTSLNPDERIALRRALRRIVQANLEIFDNAGMVEIGFSQADNEDFQGQGAPLYLTVGKLTCKAPASISTTTPPVTSTAIQATVGTEIFNG